MSPDYQILHIRYVRGKESRDLYIHNIYNDTKAHTLTQLDQQITQQVNMPMKERLIVGDINLHHPAWGGPGTIIDSQAAELLNAVSSG